MFWATVFDGLKIGVAKPRASYFLRTVQQKTQQKHKLAGNNNQK